MAAMRHVATSPIYVDAQTSPIPENDAEALMPGPEDLLMGDFFSSESGEPTGEMSCYIWYIGHFFHFFYFSNFLRKTTRNELE